MSYITCSLWPAHTLIEQINVHAPTSLSSAPAPGAPPTLVAVGRREVDARWGVGMLLAKHPLRRLHHHHIQLLGLLPPALVPVGRCEVGHAGKRVGMLFAKHPLPRLHHQHLQLLGLLPPALVPVRRHKVGNARE